jgi:hypothetical protein
LSASTRLWKWWCSNSAVNPIAPSTCSGYVERTQLHLMGANDDGRPVACRSTPVRQGAGTRMCRAGSPEERRDNTAARTGRPTPSPYGRPRSPLEGRRVRKLASLSLEGRHDGAKARRVVDIEQDVSERELLQPIRARRPWNAVRLEDRSSSTSMSMLVMTDGGAASR